MDYREIIMDEVHRLIDEFPNYTMTEILYSALREKVLGTKIESISDLKNIEDKQLYNALSRAKRIEKEDE